MNLKKSQVEAKHNFEELLLRYTDEVLKEASEVLGRKIVIQVKRQDQLRLVNLITWCDKFNISLKELLTVLFKVWSGKYKSRSVRGMGVAISTLCGPKAKQIVKDYIKKMYPNGENIELRKQDILNELLPTIDISRRADPLFFIKDYKNYIKTERKKIEDVETKLKRRRWRTNPVF